MTFMGSGWGLRKKEVNAMGHTVESRSKAQLGLGIIVSYNSVYGSLMDVIYIYIEDKIWSIICMSINFLYFYLIFGILAFGI